MMIIRLKMRWLASLVGAVFVLTLVTSCSRHHSTDDNVTYVSKDDPEMNAAIAKARNSLADFWQIYDKHPNGESDFCLKVKITDKEQNEYFWVVNLERKDGKTFGTINNDPDIVHNVKIGDRIALNEPDISDWLYMRDGKMVGNYTLRALFKHMSKDEAEKYKQMLADL
jgi:uncharacterized protein YegJ (DUF2314 family)